MTSFDAAGAVDGGKDKQDAGVGLTAGEAVGEAVGAIVGAGLVVEQDLYATDS